MWRMARPLIKKWRRCSDKNCRTNEPHIETPYGTVFGPAKAVDLIVKWARSAEKETTCPK